MGLAKKRVLVLGDGVSPHVQHAWALQLVVVVAVVVVAKGCWC